MRDRKFRVRGYVTAEAWVTVSANDRVEALEKAKMGGWRSGVGVEVGEPDKGSFTALRTDDEIARTVIVSVPAEMTIKGRLTRAAKQALLAEYTQKFSSTPLDELLIRLKIIKPKKKDKTE